jgi:hypothetical protein
MVYSTILIQIDSIPVCDKNWNLLNIYYVLSILYLIISNSHINLKMWCGEL